MLGIVVCCGLLACGDKEESYYTTLSAARDAGATERGWVPAVVPEEATDIREIHSVDTNETWGMFAFPEASVPALRVALGNSVQLGRVGRIGQPPVPWWPGELVGQEQFKWYEVDTLFVAVDWQARKGYFWRPGSKQ